MTEKDPFVKALLRKAKAVAGVPVYHAPTSAAGEKIIWRSRPAAEVHPLRGLVLELKFISADGRENCNRAASVYDALTSPEDSAVRGEDGSLIFGVTGEEGEHGYIGQTGHFFLTLRFRIRRLSPKGGEIHN